MSESKHKHYVKITLCKYKECKILTQFVETYFFSKINIYLKLKLKLTFVYFIE